MHFPFPSSVALTCCALLALPLTAPAQVGRAAAHAPLPVVTEVVQEPLPELPGKEVLVLTVDYAPGAADPVHRHNADAIVYVLSGSVVMGVAGGPEVTLGPGQTFHERPHDLHTVGRNASREKPARFLVFLLKDIGAPALMPAEQGPPHRPRGAHAALHNPQE
jgi:quercetin dioxygenase-like cupin family protein